MAQLKITSPEAPERLVELEPNNTLGRHPDNTIQILDRIVSKNHCHIDLTDGIYVLRADEALVVKRLALHPAGRRVTVQSDNPAYPDWPDCDIDDLQCIGRVIWAGRKIG